MMGTGGYGVDYILGMGWVNYYTVYYRFRGW